MALYVRKPLTVDAVQWTGYNLATVASWLTDHVVAYVARVPDNPSMESTSLSLVDDADPEEPVEQVVGIQYYLVAQGSGVRQYQPDQFLAEFQPVGS